MSQKLQKVGLRYTIASLAVPALSRLIPVALNFIDLSLFQGKLLFHPAPPCSHRATELLPALSSTIGYLQSPETFALLLFPSAIFLGLGLVLLTRSLRLCN